jgi:hypothetical protein
MSEPTRATAVLREAVEVIMSQSNGRGGSDRGLMESVAYDFFRPLTVMTSMKKEAFESSAERERRQPVLRFAIMLV